MSASTPAFSIPPVERLHAAFLPLVPRIELHARIFFRHVKCAHKKNDAVAEVLAVCWRWFVRLAERGKDATQFASTLARLAALAVKSGRRVCGQEKAQDVLSSLAQQRHGFIVSPLPPASTLNGNVFDEALRDNTRSEVPEQVAFRCDFPDWRGSYTHRDQRVIDDLMLGERTCDVAQRFGLSPGRVSQLRRAFQEDWQAFCDEWSEQDYSPSCATSSIRQVAC